MAGCLPNNKTLTPFIFMKQNHFFVALTGLVLLVFSGCSNPDSKYAMVEGTVTYNGVPLAEATVSFQATAMDGESASGTTDASGRFRLTSIGAVGSGRGALPGDYRVTVEKRELPPPDPDQVAYEQGDIDYSELQRRQSARSYASSAAPKSVIPEKYAAGSSYGLVATVTAGRNSPKFELTDE